MGMGTINYIFCDIHHLTHVHDNLNPSNVVLLRCKKLQEDASGMETLCCASLPEFLASDAHLKQREHTRWTLQRPDELLAFVLLRQCHLQDLDPCTLPCTTLSSLPGRQGASKRAAGTAVLVLPCSKVSV